MRTALLRAVRVTWSPKDEWQVIRDEAPDPLFLIARFVLPMSCIPAVCWIVGATVFSGRGLVATDGADFRVDHIVGGGIMALLGSAASVLLLAASFYVLALMFGRPRDWPRALQVAAYSFAPVFLAGVLLILPDLVFVLIIAAAHGFYVQFIGVQYVLGIKEGDAAEYVALVIMLFMMASTFLGIFGSWAGVM